MSTVVIIHYFNYLLYIYNAGDNNEYKKEDYTSYSNIFISDS